MKSVRRFASSASLPSSSTAPAPSRSLSLLQQRARSTPLSGAAHSRTRKSFVTTSPRYNCIEGKGSYMRYTSACWSAPVLSGDELFKELENFATITPTALTMDDIVSFNCPYRMAKFAIREMPIRFVYRVRLIEALPPQWREVESIVRVYEEYLTYLGHLLVQKPVDTDDQLQVFRALVREVNRLNSVPLLTTGTFELRKLTGQEFVSKHADSFLNDFFLSRISTELLSLHFLALYENPSGFVNPMCDPVRVCQTAIDVTTDLCKHHYGRAPVVDVRYHGQPEDATFTYMTSFLYYMVYELMKNSFRAVVEREGIEWVPGRPNKDLVKVLVEADKDEMRITIADEGGGIPENLASSIWSYSYTTAGRAEDTQLSLQKGQEEFVSESAQGGQVKIKNSTDDPGATDQRKNQRVSPIAGFGVGVPLSRLYAGYLGGSLDIRTAFGEGTVAKLRLKRKAGAGEILQARPHPGSVPQNHAEYTSAS